MADHPGYLSHVNDGATGVSSGGAYFSGGAEQARTAVNGKLSHYATDFIGGDHDFKFGIQYVNGNSQGHYGYTNNIAYYTYYGEPYYAYFGERYDYGGQFLNTGLFAEEMMTIGDRVTVQIGLRYDRINAKVQDINQKDQDLNTIGTAQGLGTVYTWNNVAPRLGVNIKLDDVGKTILRANYGRFYPPVRTRELGLVHPGLTPITGAFWNPLPGQNCNPNLPLDGSQIECFNDVFDFTDPIANLRIDPNTRPASQNQYSIGIDRELRPDLAISGTFVKKDARGYGSWDVLNGTYGRETIIADNGQSLEVFPLLSDPGDRIFIMTDRQELHMDYTSFLVSMNKRWSDNWQALISYKLVQDGGPIAVESRGSGLQPGGHGPEPLHRKRSERLHERRRSAAQRSHPYVPDPRKRDPSKDRHSFRHELPVLHR